MNQPACAILKVLQEHFVRRDFKPAKAQICGPQVDRVTSSFVALQAPPEDSLRIVPAGLCVRDLAQPKAPRTRRLRTGLGYAAFLKFASTTFLSVASASTKSAHC